LLKKSFLLAVVLIFSLSAQVLAEEIVLKSGEKLEGKVLEKTDKYIKVDPGIGMVMTYYAEDIDTIDGQKFQITPASSPVVDAPPVNQSSDQTTAENTNNSEVGDLSQAEDSIKNGDYGTAEIILNKLINNGSKILAFTRIGPYVIGISRIMMMPTVIILRPSKLILSKGRNYLK